jgi:hypothetical protein
MGGRKRTRASVAAPSTGDQPDIVTLTSKEGEADALRSNLAVLWREGTLCDVTLIASARHFPAHRLVLAAASPYMKALLAGEHFAESTAKEFELPELSASVRSDGIKSETHLSHCLHSRFSFGKRSLRSRFSALLHSLP